MFSELSSCRIRAARSAFVACGLLALSCLAASPTASGHGTLLGDRMYQVRAAGPNGNTPAAWNGSYYTWNQNSQNFPGYAAPGFSYASAVPNGKLANAGINDGVQTALDFSGLNTPSAGWQALSASAGGTLPLHWLATAPHDPSYFEVFFTKPGFDITTGVLTWQALDYLGRWAIGDAAHPVTNSTGSSPAGGSLLSYDWNIPIPATASGREAVLVIWQRQDPAGEAFFALQDISVAPVPESASLAMLLFSAAALLARRRTC